MYLAKIGGVEPETAAGGPLEVPVGPRAAAVEPVVAPVDKGSSPSEAPEALFFSSGLSFSPSGAHINDARYVLGSSGPKSRKDSSSSSSLEVTSCNRLFQTSPAKLKWIEQSLNLY